MSDWQPIETAPKDGTEFLAAIQVHNTRGDEWWERHVVAVDDATGDLISDQPWSLGDYSHWMPLPDPPKEETSDVG